MSFEQLEDFLPTFLLFLPTIGGILPTFQNYLPTFLAAMEVLSIQITERNLNMNMCSGKPTLRR